MKDEMYGPTTKVVVLVVGLCAVYLGLVFWPMLTFTGYVGKFCDLAYPGTCYEAVPPGPDWLLKWAR